MRNRLPIVLVLAGSLIVGACTEEGGGETASGSPTISSPPSTSVSSSPTPSPEPTGSPSPSEAASPVLEDGRHFGFIQSVDLSTQVPTLVFDLAYFLTGDEANEAAAEHGDEVPVPNDYYIVNDNPRLRTLTLDPDVRLELVDWANCCDAVFLGDLVPFAESFEETTYPSGPYKGGFSPYWLIVEHGVVVEIEEQFLP
ncbi:MAG: hypothetical protein AB1551_02755 [Actinomycetota bacterium]